jgi:flagellar motor switch protein FliN
MQMHLRFDAVTRTFADELSAGWSSKLGLQLAVAPAGAAAGPGWLVTVDTSGAATGTLTAWFARDSALACARLALGNESEPDEPSVVALLKTLVAHAVANIESSAVGAGLTMGEAVVKAGVCPAGAQAFSAPVNAEVACQYAVLADFPLPASPRSTDRRLEAVLDVDLPLIVRFGRAVMPLRQVADLGPGSVVDMGRSPDEPVDLLVGERVIARGEVVIVAGNYGVRITELMGGRESSPEMEARPS